MIAAMISGRLKAPAKWELIPRNYTTKTTATIIAPDAANRATQVLIETTDDDLGRTLRKLQAGAMVTVTGEVNVPTNGRLLLRVRTVEALNAQQISA